MNGCFLEEFLGIADWNKLKTIEEMSEGYLFGDNSNNTMTREIKPVIPIMVRSEVEYMER